MYAVANLMKATGEADALSDHENQKRNVDVLMTSFAKVLLFFEHDDDELV